MPAPASLGCMAQTSKCSPSRIPLNRSAAAMSDGRIQQSSEVLVDVLDGILLIPSSVVPAAQRASGRSSCTVVLVAVLAATARSLLMVLSENMMTASLAEDGAVTAQVWGA